MAQGSILAAPLFHGLTETIWGRRGFVKINGLWLPLSVLLVAPSRISERPSLADCMLLVCAVACWAAGSILVNDIADAGADRASGKHRWITALHAPAGASIILIAWGIGGFLVFYVGNADTVAAYAGAIVLSLLYSIKPFQLKRRSAWGLSAYSASCTLAYVGVPWAFINGDVQSLTVLALAVFLDKWVNLHFHQVIDIDADLAANVYTYAAAAGLERARQMLALFARVSSLTLCLAWIFAVYRMPAYGGLLVFAGVGTSIAAGVFALVQRGKSRSPLMQELPWYYLALTYSVLRVTPATIFLCLAYWDRSMAPLAAAAIGMVAWETALSLFYRRP